ncbi:enhancer of split m5 protein-like [Musca vetustissima]|uniref:enhancer of split m5 protein-like n=1 Tax=Musca vetustissima TaxID=27455 RepID=UPI002AB736C9|nr:enhancer of split m5 protein-like [Musca vetustissima]
MAPQMEFVSKTQHYLKVKKPQLERERRARINKCLDTLKELVAEFQGNDSILHMDKAEMLETAVKFIKTQVRKPKAPVVPTVPMDSFRHGYMNAVNEVSRVMAATPGMNVQLGKAVMIHLGCEYNRLSEATTPVQTEEICSAPMSPASSGYHSDEDISPAASPAPSTPVWRPW